MTRIEYRCSVKKDCGKSNDDIIALDRVMPGAEGPEGMTITFMRTIRVPDNAEINNLPPGLGSFPLYKVSDHSSRLPDEVVRKGGAFFPMHQKEAMWIRFSSTAPFKIKIFAGGINVVSGEHIKETVTPKTGYMSLQSASQNTQDYIVVPKQLWIDGVAVKPGVVRQFVAMPLGQGYTVEAQLTGEEFKGGLQLEITPSMKLLKLDPSEPPEVVGDFYVVLRTVTGKIINIPANLTDAINDLKLRIQDKEGIPPDQQSLILFGQRLHGSFTVADYQIPKGATLHLIIRLRGGGPQPLRMQEEHEMGIAPGGFIKQDIRKDTYDSVIWLRDLTFTVPVQILSTQMFKEVTGSEAPPCPINAQTYANAGLPFFDLFEETPSDVSGADAFAPLKSVNEMETAQGLVTGQEPMVAPRTVKLHETSLGTKIWSDEDVFHVDDPDGLLNPDGPRRSVPRFAGLR